MGCTPSIHVNQTGVVYCRESDGGSNSPRASHSATVIAGNTMVRTETTDTSHSSARSKRHVEYNFPGPSNTISSGRRLSYPGGQVYDKVSGHASGIVNVTCFLVIPSLVLFAAVYVVTRM